MDTKTLEKFAQAARRQLHEEVGARLAQVLQTDSIERREKPQVVAQLEREVRAASYDAVVERVAYTWFNRFCALRYMDVNRYTRAGIVSPAAGFTQPEILQEAKQGHVDPELAGPEVAAKVLGLLAGRLPSPAPEQEAYRLLLVAACNSYYATMPFLFERIDDYSELLMPLDLLSSGSILQGVRATLTPAACQDVEVIGWLYQFYISEKKDAVFAALKQGKKIEAADIPAATQLFTPHWIVRFLVENSLGRLWLLNRPTSRLSEQMPYYIRPEQEETDFLRVNSPEELRICDPACGSGHMLTYAFDLLYAIYAEEGYNPPDIPRLILEQNLCGVEIDARAGALAAFALAMKARAQDKRFFTRGVRPRVCVLHPLEVTEKELAAAPWYQQLGKSLLELPARDALRADAQAWEDVEFAGSLLRPQLTPEQIALLRARIGAADDLFSHGLNERVLDLLEQVEYLARKYHVVVANPPYMGGKGMDESLGDFLKADYRKFSADLFSAFVARIMEISTAGAFAGMMTPFTWMYLSGYEEMREYLLRSSTLVTLVRPEYHSFFDSAYVPICAFTVFLKSLPHYRGSFIDLNDFYGADIQPTKTLEAIKNPSCSWVWRASSVDFGKIAGLPIAYWISETVRRCFTDLPAIDDFADAKQGLITGDNERFLRYWTEVAFSRIGIGYADRRSASVSGNRWFPHQKGGQFRKWYGNHEYVVDWQRDGERIRAFVDSAGRLRSRPQNLDYYFKPAITWTALTVSSFNGRISPAGHVYDAKGPILWPHDAGMLLFLAGLLNSRPANYMLKILAPTMDYNQGPVAKVPVPVVDHGVRSGIIDLVSQLEQIAKRDWDLYEGSWDFSYSPLVNSGATNDALSATHSRLRAHWREITCEMQRLEEENNRIFIEAYGLQDELSPTVPLEEITLTCNPVYRYGAGKSEEEYERLLRADTMREFISYAVGCMFGRYSLDVPGLVLANQGGTLDDYLRRVPTPTFPPDKDNVIPLLDGDWFADDIVERLRKFLRVTFGAQHFDANLAFIEEALGRDLRSYFLREFYSDHVRRYQKRPIYWLFSSPRGSFNALIYMHRYRPDTVSVVLNDYLREFRTKLGARKAHLEQVSISAAASAREKTAALKEISTLDKTLRELEEYEDDVLFPLATRKVQIDLDDGVKVNYNKLGGALKKVTGLTG